MSKRLIDANELILAMYYYEHNEGGLTAYDAQDIINKAPTIEPKQGEWIEPADDESISITGRCSNCGWEAHLLEDDVVGMPFCPNCGADMREREGE